MSEICIALLRGVNVGGHNRLPMDRLATLVRGIGGRDVRTYIQSGNVIFVAPEAVVQRAVGDLADALAEHAGISSPVVVRSLEALRHVVAGNPYLQAGHAESELYVAFLADEPQQSAVEALDDRRSPPDEFTVVGREIYLCCPNGLARTKLSNAYFDSRLGTTSTVRNWRTTLKLLELAAETRA